MSLSRFRKPIHSPAELRRATLISSAPSRDTMRRSPLASSVRTSRCRSPRCSSRCEKLIAQYVGGHPPSRSCGATGRPPLQLGEQTACVLRFHHSLDTDRHGGGAVGNLVCFRAPDDLRKRMLQDAEKFVSHFGFRPH